MPWLIGVSMKQLFLCIIKCLLSISKPHIVQHLPVFCMEVSYKIWFLTTIWFFPVVSLCLQLYFYKVNQTRFSNIHKLTCTFIMFTAIRFWKCLIMLLTTFKMICIIDSGVFRTLVLDTEVSLQTFSPQLSEKRM